LGGNAGIVEKSGLYPSMEHHDKRRRKREVDEVCEQFRGLDSYSASAIVSGA
jgi:hypothetical protein